jgi:hypothetical protein
MYFKDQFFFLWLSLYLSYTVKHKRKLWNLENIFFHFLMSNTSFGRYGFNFGLIYCIYWNLKISFLRHEFCHISVLPNQSLDYSLQRLIRHKFTTFQLTPSPDLTSKGEQRDFEKWSSAVYSPEMRGSLLGKGSEFQKASVQKL